MSELNVKYKKQHVKKPKGLFLSSTPLWNFSTDGNALSVAISTNGKYVFRKYSYVPQNLQNSWELK